jgi:signal transduction histidine kinase
MSHEIRTPMNGVKGMIDLALGAQPTPEQAEYLRTAHESANGLLGVVNDILDFSKIEAGKLEMDAADFEVGALLEEIVRGFALRAVEQAGGRAEMEPLRGIPVLVVEPHATTRRILVETLSGWGMLASAASDAPAARGAFKLVLADSQGRPRV